jgi:hypothetical protein
MAHGYKITDFNFSSSYTTGGEAFDDRLDPPVAVILPQPKGGYVFDFDYAAKKIKAYRQNATTGALVEVAAAVNLSGVNPVQVLIMSRA